MCFIHMFNSTMTFKRPLIFGLVIAACVAGYYYANRPPTSIVLTGIVTTHDLVISPRIGGLLDKINVAEGDKVVSGQVIAVIAPEELRAESTYASRNVEGLSSQVDESRAALRLQEK